MSLRIDWICLDGSPLGPTSKTLFGDGRRVGLGGSEQAMITLCEIFQAAGHDVTLYNDPWESGVSPFQQLPISAFDPNADRDLLINFRSPNPRSLVAKGYRLWLTCDQFSTGDYRAFGPLMNSIICISPRHQQFFRETYGLTNAEYIDLPVRVPEIPIRVPKINHSLIFTSVPARGLSNVRRMWPHIKNMWPDATLTITSDYRLWGCEPSNEQFRAQFISQKDLRFLGAIPRRQYLEEIGNAQILFYPSNYDELFCYAVAEAQVAGCRTITSSTGSLPTTNMDVVLPGSGDDGNMDGTYYETLKSLDISKEKSEEIHVKSIQRFSPENILRQWEEKVFSKI